MAQPHHKTPGSARTAIIYITIGAIMDVWTSIWYIYMRRHDTPGDAPYFWCYGFFFTGLTLILIGLALGRIGRSARHADLPPEGAPNPAPQINQPAAPPAVGTAPAPRAAVAPVVPAAPAQAVVVPTGNLPPR